MKFEDQTNRAPEHCADTEPFPPVPFVIQLLHLVWYTSKVIKLIRLFLFLEINY